MSLTAVKSSNELTSGLIDTLCKRGYGIAPRDCIILGVVIKSNISP